MIKTIVTDCDGTLTDGKYYYTAEGRQSVAFHTHDSYAANIIKESGIRLIVISSGTNQRINKKRSEELGAEYMYAPPGKKLDVIKSLDLLLSETAYIGDCIDDIPSLLACALSFCPKESVVSVREASNVVLTRAGGEGCLLDAWLLLVKYNKINRGENAIRN